MMHRLLALCLAWTGFAGFSPGGEPKPVQPLELIPRTAVITMQPGSPFRFGTREVWQNYAVDSMGRWRPIVYRAPDSLSFHRLYDGQEYYWWTVRPLDFMPYAD